MKKIFLYLLVILLFPCAIVNAETVLDRPHWSFELKGGLFVPSFDTWSSFYGRRDTSQYGGSLAYKILKQVEVGIEGSSISDKGHGIGLLHETSAGKVTIDLYPLNVFVLFRGEFGNDQWLIPYAGGGWTRIYYKEEIEHQGTARGSVNGYHARAGIQLLLDGLDSDAANRMFLDYGVFHTYFFIEGQYTRAMADTVSQGSVNLGGKSWLGGLLFEF